MKIRIWSKHKAGEQDEDEDHEVGEPEATEEETGPEDKKTLANIYRLVTNNDNRSEEDWGTREKEPDQEHYQEDGYEDHKARSVNNNILSKEDPGKVPEPYQEHLKDKGQEDHEARSKEDWNEDQEANKEGKSRSVNRKQRAPLTWMQGVSLLG